MQGFTRRIHLSTPNSTDTWRPIPHHTLLGEVLEVVAASGMRKVAEAHALAYQQMRYFGVVELDAEELSDEMTIVLGIRNSHDKSYAASLVAGTGLPDSGIITFTGESELRRMHTRFILRDLPELVREAADELPGFWSEQAERVKAYKQQELSDSEAHDLIVQMLDEELIVGSRIPRILDKWRDPNHVAFDHEKNVWRLYNAALQHLRGNVVQRPDQTQTLNNLLDQMAGFDPSPANVNAGGDGTAEDTSPSKGPRIPVLS